MPPILFEAWCSAKACRSSSAGWPWLWSRRSSSLFIGHVWVLRGLRASGIACRFMPGRSALPRSARKPRFMPTPSSGKAMADHETEIIAKIASGVSGLNPRAWDRLVGSDPFVSHGFLSALEDSGSVGPGTGWTPAPILVEDDADHLIAAAPAYLKTHSQGEYVFDHGWAEAWVQAGGDYYPKLQVAVPFTPVPGPRLLGSRPQQLLTAIEAVTVQNDMSSAHITFLDEAAAAQCEARGWLIRHGVQYHWFNRGYSSFDDFLATLTSRKRKSLRKERAIAIEGLEMRILRGTEIGPAEWDAMWAFYQDTGS